MRRFGRCQAAARQRRRRVGARLGRRNAARTRGSGANSALFAESNARQAGAVESVRLLLLSGADPMGAEGDAETALFAANPTRYRSDCAALIALAVGLASLQLPVLIVTSVAEYLVAINEERLFGSYSEQKSWEVAAWIQKKAQNNLN